MKLVLVREQSLKSSEGGMDGARTDIYSAETAIGLIEHVYHWARDWFWYDKNSPLEVLNYSPKGDEIESLTMNCDGENLTEREETEDDFWFEARVGDAPRHFMTAESPDSKRINMHTMTYGAVSEGEFSEVTGVYNEAVAKATSVLEAGDDWFALASSKPLDRPWFTQEQRACIRAYALAFIEPSEFDHPKRLSWLVLRDFFVGLKKDISGLDLSAFTKEDLLAIEWGDVTVDEQTQFPDGVSDIGELK